MQTFGWKSAVKKSGRLQEAGITIVFVTHDQRRLLSMSDTLWFFAERGGRAKSVPQNSVTMHAATVFAAGFIGTLTDEVFCLRPTSR